MRNIFSEDLNCIDKQFAGLKIKFKKYNLSYDKRGECANHSQSIIAFGYYDSIEIQTVDDILKFTPSCDLNLADDVKDSEYRTEYVLKLIKIVNANDKDAEHWCLDKKIIKYPFMSIVSIDLNDKIIFSCKKDYSNGTKENLVRIIKESIKNICDIIGYNEYCATFLCIGYTDVVVLLQSKSINKMQCFVNLLREYKVKSGDFLVSSIYTVFGLQRNYVGDFVNEKIDATFKWTYSSSELENTLISEPFFDNMLKIQDTNIVKVFNLEYGIFDKSCHLHISLYDFYNLFGENPYQYKGIKNFNTNICFNYNCNMPFLPKRKIDNSNKQINVKSALEDFLRTYSCLIEKDDLHKRLFCVMKDMEYLYELIVLTNHSNDIVQIVGSFYKETLRSLHYIVEEYISKINNDADKKMSCIDQLERAIEYFRNSVQFLLFDILRSDHSFFEVPSIAHPSIGGTTKILMAYNQIVNKWNRSINENDTNKDISFLVTSGGCNTTQVLNLLSYFEDILPEKYKLPVIITIPEASLYDIKATMFRLAHEFFHLKGNRFRRGGEAEGEKYFGRYSHFYKGLINEYIDYCCVNINDRSIIVKDSDDKQSFIDNLISSKDFEFYLKDKDIFVNFDDASSKFIYNERKLKGRAHGGYADIVISNLESSLFSDSFEFVDLKLTLNFIVLKGQDEDSKFQKLIGKYRVFFDSIKFLYRKKEKIVIKQFKDFYYTVIRDDDVENINPIKILINYFREKVETYRCKYRSVINYLYNRIKDLFLKYDYEYFDEFTFVDNLCKLFSEAPVNAFKYATEQSHYLPNPIIYLSGIYCMVEENKQKKKREENEKRQKLVFSCRQGGLDFYNFPDNDFFKKDIQEIQHIAPIVEFYSKFWIKATLNFFLSPGEKINPVLPLNCRQYRDIVSSLYKESFADICTLCLMKKLFPHTSKFEIVKDYVGAFLSEQLNVKRLFGMGESVDAEIATRIGAVIFVFMNGELLDRKELSNYIVEIYNKKTQKVNMETNLNDFVYSQIRQLFQLFIRLLKSKSYVNELVKYLKECAKNSYELFDVGNSNDELNLLLEEWLSIYTE